MKYPKELQTLIDDGKWPEHDSTLKGVITNVVLLKMFPEESGHLVLTPTPFITMKKEAEILKNISHDAGVQLYLNVENPDQSVIIGWFGHGADTALIVDCSTERYEVKKYVFDDCWRSLGTFKEFHDKLNLPNAKYKRYC